MVLYVLKLVGKHGDREPEIFESLGSLGKGEVSSRQPRRIGTASISGPEG